MDRWIDRYTIIPPRHNDSLVQGVDDRRESGELKSSGFRCCVSTPESGEILFHELRPPRHNGQCCRMSWEFGLSDESRCTTIEDVANAAASSATEGRNG